VEAEIVRDMSLAVGGLLSERVGGPSVFPPIPAGVARQSYAFNFTWTESEGEDRHRRGLYTFFKRTAPDPNLTGFDAPDAITSCVARQRSNTPLQALAALNNEVFFEAARGFAARILELDADDGTRLRRAFRLALARAPSAAEEHELRGLLAVGRAWYAENPRDVDLMVMDGGVGPPPEVESAEFAAWVATLRVLLNLDEFLVRA
jgi:hypothetical protein